MSADVLARPERLSLGPGEVDHFDCCDPDTAMCGYDIAGWTNVDDEDSRLPTCPLCRELVENDRPCTSLTCPALPGIRARMRRWWRSL